MRSDAWSRLVECQDLLRQEPLLSVRDVAQRTGVSERTVHRYLREMHGGSRRPPTLYERVMPLILAHLRRYPQSRFTRGELARVLLGDRTVHLTPTLLRMEREGLVTRTVEARTDGLFSPKQPIVWWQLDADAALTAEQAQLVSEEA
ncbi:winged helix-turn-helix domain-containing protein [Nonomuraea angiospora]|uniref:winged helix-turn-helix domain-containing protein n=1 Tax=Nonomuraea angiospora TaxID=46172 RepID=UPI003450892E